LIVNNSSICVSSQLSLVFEELSPALEMVLAQGHPGVVVALVEACRRVGTHQAQVLQLLFEVSGCYFSVRPGPDLTLVEICLIWMWDGTY
jgi:hypothetical protein